MGEKEAEEFARNLSGKCLPGKRNIYQIKKNDNLGRIAEGLTRGRITLKMWDTTLVTFLDPTNAKGPIKMALLKAHSIAIGDFVGVSDDLHIIVSSHLSHVLSKARICSKTVMK